MEYVTYITVVLASRVVNVIYSFRIWEDFVALLNLLQVANPNLPEKIGESKSSINAGNTGNS